MIDTYHKMRKKRIMDIENGHEASLNLFRQIILKNYSRDNWTR